MTPHEALWLIKTQLAKTEQNIQAVQVIEELVKEYYYEPITLEDIRDSMFKTHTLDEDFFEVFGTEAQHVKNHMKKVGEQDLKKYYSRELLDFEEYGDDE
jgi:hypothetical protein